MGFNKNKMRVHVKFVQTKLGSRKKHTAAVKSLKSKILLNFHAYATVCLYARPRHAYIHIGLYVFPCHLRPEIAHEQK
jgi:hypothetical protein